MYFVKSCNICLTGFYMPSPVPGFLGMFQNSDRQFQIFKLISLDRTSANTQCCFMFTVVQWNYQSKLYSKKSDLTYIGAIRWEYRLFFWGQLGFYLLWGTFGDDFWWKMKNTKFSHGREIDEKIKFFSVFWLAQSCTGRWKFYFFSRTLLGRLPNYC